MELDKEEYTIKDLCKLYNITSVTVERWRKNKGLPYIKRGRNVYFIKKDVEKWIGSYYNTKKYNYEKEKASN